MLQFTYWILPLQRSTITALVAPEGSTIYEFDLSALQLDPHNKKALKNLRASFDPACHTVEEAIANGELDEAERELRLLRDYGAQQTVQHAIGWNHL